MHCQAPPASARAVHTAAPDGSVTVMLVAGSLVPVMLGDVELVAEGAEMEGEVGGVRSTM
ncbi:hypothetical protein E6C70_10140 [Glaciibacter flavus]|uniref:Uncharacterized protein n=1 Tax=Orlajensenia flava TaxID=2565934 RepID=A0A4S4FWZ3_9MICO|nr:hypothetical protein E6C70_10140 [Glaciibacter flavus]